MHQMVRVRCKGDFDFFECSVFGFLLKTRLAGQGKPVESIRQALFFC